MTSIPAFHKIFLVQLIMSWALCISTFSQTPVSNLQVTFRETIWLQTPRHIYVAGERLDFHASLLERDTYKPSVLSKNIRIELLDSAGNKLYKKNIELVNAQVKGSLILSPEIKSGWYYLRAYTNWMRNFPESEFSVVPVKVVNLADSNPDLESLAETDIGAPVVFHNDLLVTERNDQLVVELRNISLEGTANLRLLVHKSCSWYGFESKTLTDNAISFIIPKNQIPEGIVQFSVLRDDNTILASRLWSGYDAGRNQVSMNLTPEKTRIRGDNQLEFNFPEDWKDGSDVRMNALISLDEPGNQDRDYLPGLPGWCSNAMIPNGKEAFRNWLLKNHYPDETVQAFFTSASPQPVSPDEHNLRDLDKPGILFFPETRSGILSGRVINKLSGEGVPSIGVGLTILNDNSFDAVKTNRDGVFCFGLPALWNPRDYILNFISEPDSAWSIEVFPEYDVRAFKPVNKIFSLSREEFEYAGNLNVNLQLDQVYARVESGERSRRDPLIRKKPFYDPPERTIFTDDFIELANVLEVVYEVVPDVQVRRKGNRAYLSVYNKNSFARDYETLILLDGIPLTDHKELLDLPPGRIKAIEVKNRVYIHGNYIFSAIVNFISRNGDFAGLRLPAHSVLGSLDLPVPAESVLQISQGSSSVDLPGLNPVIIWNTDILPPDRKFRFQANDLSGEFSLRIYGYDQNGQWFFGRTGMVINPPGS